MDLISGNLGIDPSAQTIQWKEAHTQSLTTFLSWRISWLAAIRVVGKELSIFSILEEPSHRHEGGITSGGESGKLVGLRRRLVFLHYPHSRSRSRLNSQLAEGE